MWTDGAAPEVWLNCCSNTLLSSSLFHYIFSPCFELLFSPPLILQTQSMSRVARNMNRANLLAYCNGGRTDIRSDTLLSPCFRPFSVFLPATIRRQYDSLRVTERQTERKNNKQPLRSAPLLHFSGSVEKSLSLHCHHLLPAERKCSLVCCHWWSKLLAQRPASCPASF